jgi:hypothetical protein
MPGRDESGASPIAAVCVQARRTTSERYRDATARDRTEGSELVTIVQFYTIVVIDNFLPLGLQMNVVRLASRRGQPMIGP